MSTKTRALLSTVYWLWGESMAFIDVLPTPLPSDATGLMVTVSQYRGRAPFFTAPADLLDTGRYSWTVQGGDGERLPNVSHSDPPTSNAEARYWYSLWVTRERGPATRIGSGPFCVEHNPEWR